MIQKEYIILDADHETPENGSNVIDDLNGQIPAGLEAIPLIRFSSCKQKEGYSDERQMTLIKQRGLSQADIL